MPTAELRREDARLLRGDGGYVADIACDGALHAAIVRSPVAHGRIASIDVDQALRHPGVHAVLTASDLPRLHIPIRRAGREGMERFLQPVLAATDVRYVGEPVAVVVADDAYIAEVGADLVELVIDPLPAATSVAALGDAAPGPWAGEPLYRFECASGDVDDAFRRADVVVSVDAAVGRQTGLPMETRGVTAEWRGDDLHLWGPAKFVRYTTEAIADLLDVAGAVHTHRVDVGGMFGPRGELYPEDLLVPLASRVVGRPVRWIEDRREHLISINHSRGQHHTFELAATKDGDLLGFRATCRLDVGAYTRPIGARLGELVVEVLPGPYRWTDFSVECTGVLTNKTPTGTMRGPSGLESNFVRERALDVLAFRLGMDPADVRRRNLIAPSELPFRRSVGGGVHDVEYDAGDYPAAFETILAAAGYESGSRTRGGSGDGIVRGSGIGAFLEASGIGVVESVEVELTAAGRIRVGTTASEIGQGLASMLARVVAQTLGLPEVLVDVDLGSSAAHEGGSGTYGSRTTIFTGSAAIVACRRLVAEIRDEVAAAHDVDPDDVVLDAEGAAWPGGHAGWSELGPRRVVGEHRSEGPTFGFGCVVAQVAIDPELGGLRVDDLTVGYDCGRALDRAAVDGQLRGAAVQGLGGALLEELPYDEDGQPLATTFMDYLVPTCAEVPDVRTVVIEGGPIAGNPLGVRGVGEAGLVGVGAAIGNAVADAAGLGPLPTERLPLRPQDVAEAFGADRSDDVPPTTATPPVDPSGPPADGSSTTSLRSSLVLAVLSALAAIGLVGLLRAARRRRR